jgi:cytochrome c biogenesis protein CcmG/thiol:disulfide interchange protein DsbE
MSSTEQQGTIPEQSPDVGQIEWRRHLWWVLPLVALAVLAFGSWARGLRADPTVVVQADAGAQTAAAPETAPSAQSAEPTPESAAAEPTVDLPVAPVEGALAPDFTLKDLHGQEWTLSELRGKAVMLNFWATWWPYCRAERSALQAGYERYSDQGLVLLSIDIREPKELVQIFVDGQELTFPVLLDETGAVAQTYRLRAVPYSLFIDRQGVIQTMYIGPMDETLLEAYVGAIL